ncbi:para-aminobenzoate synthetase component 2 [Clostridium sp. USBA 49]|uniref:anthranilate synthase component II n=1 Tax=Clostridium sp. USBA 49 TaxID=1881060 RepID=UPI000999DA82|nr:aminodeoxychorismate/anthranilate synthase component II [Clostridium sp. USBA 49]SKA87590.1 para-aminobenzoate synthetase component 2 [Clostridium sp. USBA 49]
MILMIDNYDSFVYNLFRYFKEINEEICVYRNDKITLKQIEELNPEAIILSPGPKSPLEAGICLDVVHYFKEKTPIFGICLGHQTICSYFGSKIIKGEKPVHGKVTPIYHNSQGVFKGLKNPINVTRYHSLIVDKHTLPSELKITAETEDGVIMAVKHKKYLIEGVQFHPEAELTEYGHQMLKNFLLEVRGRRNTF